MGLKCVLKAIAALIAVAALVCVILEYWDELVHLLGALHERMAKFGRKCCRKDEDADAGDFAEAAE